MRRSKQRWEEVGRRFTPPTHRIANLRGYEPDDLRKILFGYTTIELREVNTGDVKFIEQPGDQTVRWL